MNQGQEQFLGFILKNATSENHEAVKKLLGSAFKMHSEGKFNLEELEKMAPKLHELVKPETLEEVKGAMAHFAGTLKK